ncbi:MAG: twin-arginine translocation signal domain-containing protein, partial [Verrucomicrobiota bacterium]
MSEEILDKDGFSRRGFLTAGLLAGGAMGLGSREAVAKPMNPSAAFLGSRIHGSDTIAPTSPMKEMGLLFEELKRSASKEELYKFLYALPKGGDIHHHFGGGMLPEMWWDLATDKS